MKTLARLFLFIVACATVLGLTAKETIKIGVILPLTGNSAHLGEPLRELIEYKIAHLPKDSRFEYKAIFEDDQLIIRQSLLAAHRLVELEHVDMLITFFTGPGTVVAPYATQKKIPHLMYSFNESVADGQYNFIYITPLRDCIKTIIPYMERKGYRKVGLLLFRNPAGDACQKLFDELIPASKLQVVASEHFNPGERDFRLTLAKLREAKPDVLFIFSIAPELQIILRQAREIGWDIPITSTGNFEIATQDPLCDGRWFVGICRPTPEFQRWYGDTFKKPYPYGAATYSDMVDLLYGAFEKSGTSGRPTGEAVTAQLRAIKDFKGATGTVSVNEHGLLATPATMVIIKNKTVVPLEE